MIVEKAKGLYHGAEKYNCAQAILKAFQDVYDVSEEMILEYKANGGGRTEGNVCGAVYAAAKLVDEDQKAGVLDKFKEKSKHLECKKIRSEKTLSCVGCVEAAAEILKEMNDL